jgi:hypothetical protein
MSGKINNLAWTMNYGFRVGDVSNSIVRIGFMDSTTTVPTNGIYLSVTNATAAGTWFGVARSSTTESINQSSALTCDTNWHTFTVVSSGATNITYFIDGSLKATVTANVPSTGLRPVIQYLNTDGVATVMQIDWFDLLMTISR